MKSIVLIVATRPNFMKAAPVYRALKQLNKYNVHVIHTGQHYDKNMSDIFLQQLNLPITKNLDIVHGTQNQQIADVMVKLEQYFIENKTDMLIVFGDVSSTVAAAMCAVKMGIPVSHVEAGLRSHDHTMPEEINRIIVDSISTHLFVSEESGLANLAQIINPVAQQMYHIGNCMADSLLAIKPLATKSQYYKTLNLTKQNYILVTLHRKNNVDNPAKLAILMDTLNTLSRDHTIVFPVHPRRRSKIKLLCKSNNIILLDPIGYLEFINLQIYCKLIITDSGGIQEESTILGIPCITTRPNTERPATILHGTNTLSNINKHDILKLVKQYTQHTKHTTPIKFWSGGTSTRIASIIDKIL